MVTSPLIPLGISLLVALLTSIISRKVRIPLIALEILIGILLGKSWLGLIPYEYDPYLEFLSSFGLIYLLFLAGLEMGMKEVRYESVLLASLSLLAPFTLGALLGLLWNIQPIFLGALLSTTSIGVVLPITKELNLEDDLKKIILESALIVDAASMFILTISIESIKGTPVSSIMFSLFLALSLFILPLIVRIHSIKMVLSKWLKTESHFKHEVRFCFALMVTLAILFEILGFHAILGAFLAGLMISEVTEEGSLLRGKMLGLGYGLFIPIFFILAGAATNLPLLIKYENIALVPMLLLAGIIGKVMGVNTAGVLFKFPFRIALSIGLLHSARLSLIIAGAKLGLDLGLIVEEVYSAIVIFALITVLLPPTIAKILLASRTRKISR